MQGDMSLSCPWNISFLHFSCLPVPVPGDGEVSAGSLLSVLSEEQICVNEVIP